MKKIILVILALIICSTSLITYAISANDKDNPIENKKEVSMDFELLPTMDSKSNAKNQVWVGTFQLVWNDLIDELIKKPIEFVGYKSTMAEELNQKSFGVMDLSDSSYYKKWGLASPILKTEIENGIKEKFNEKSDILDSFDWTPAEKKYILYAMLKKDFEFVEHFDTLDKAVFHGSSEDVEYFGLKKHAPYKQRKTVDVLFYNNKDDFALKLKTKKEDIVYLYRTNDDKNLTSYYSDMQMKEKNYKGDNSFNDIDEFKAPVLDFKSERNFDELCGKQIKNSDLIISRAIETILFKMDEAGVKLKSEAGIGIALGCMPSNIDIIVSRLFYFDDNYIIFIAEEGKKPYFAMKVTDAAKLRE